MPFRKKGVYKKEKRFTDKPIPVTMIDDGYKKIYRHIYFENGFGTYIKHNKKRILVSATYTHGEGRNSAFTIPKRWKE